jgi:hypothetical protein
MLTRITRNSLAKLTQESLDNDLARDRVLLFILVGGNRKIQIRFGTTVTLNGDVVFG